MDLDDLEALESEEALLEAQASSDKPKKKSGGNGGLGKRKRGDTKEVDAADEKQPGPAGKKLKFMCFICDQRKLANSKFCRAHHRSMEAIKYQAMNAQAG